MRRFAALVLGLLATGCIDAGDAGPAAIRTDDLLPPLRLLVLDLEVRPLADVVVTLGNRTATSTDDGLVAFEGVLPGPQAVTAWAAGRYENRSMLDVTDLNLTYEIFLAERPEYIGFVKVGSLDGTCNVVKTGPVPADRECQPMPPSSETDNRGIQEIVANVSRLEVWMTWSGTPATFEMALDFSRAGQPLPMADGQSSITVEGGSPLWIDLGLDSFPPEVRAEPFQLALEVQPGHGDGPEFANRAFTIATTMWFHEPPPDDPCELHPDFCP